MFTNFMYHEDIDDKHTHTHTRLHPQVQKRLHSSKVYKWYEVQSMDL